MSFYLEVPGGPDSVNRVLQPFVFEGLDPAASIADQVVMVMAGRVDPLVCGRVPAQIDPLDKTKLFELFESPVDRGPAYPLEFPVDLERRDGAVPGPQEFDHLPPRAAPPIAGGIES